MVEYNIIGSSMQSLDVRLEPGERIYSDSGKFQSKSANVIMNPKFVGGVMGIISRKATGSTAMLTEFEARKGEGMLSLSGTMPGKILGIDLKKDDEFVVEKYAFLAAEDTVGYSVQTLGLGAGFLGGEGFVLQKLRGPGKIFIHTVGDMLQHDVTEDSPIHVEPGHIAGFDSTLSFNVSLVDNVKTMLFGGIGLFMASFKGHGRLLLHSVSRYKMAAELFSQGLKYYSKNKGKYDQ